MRQSWHSSNQSQHFAEVSPKYAASSSTDLGDLLAFLHYVIKKLVVKLITRMNQTKKTTKTNFDQVALYQSNKRCHDWPRECQYCRDSQGQLPRHQYRFHKGKQAHDEEGSVPNIPAAPQLQSPCVTTRGPFRGLVSSTLNNNRLNMAII